MLLTDNSMRLHQYSISNQLTVIFAKLESEPTSILLTLKKHYNYNSTNLNCFNLTNNIQNYWSMANLDLSQHQLNLSASKQKYSFPKTKRFVQTNKALCDSLYALPNTFSKRGTTLGYGNKTLGNQSNPLVPGVGTYSFQSDINPEHNKQRSFTFGVSREKMESGGALGHVKFLQKIPAPGTYQPKDVADRRAPSMRSRHPDHDFQKFAKNPGPGTYQHENMGSRSYYLNSRYKNDTNVKISQVSRLAPISSKLPKVGPADYSPVDSLSGSGKYSLAKHQGINSCVFSRSQRQGLTQKTQSGFPGPGQYNSFSGFG